MSSSCEYLRLSSTIGFQSFVPNFLLMRSASPATWAAYSLYFSTDSRVGAAICNIVRLPLYSGCASSKNSIHYPLRVIKPVHAEHQMPACDSKVFQNFPTRLFMRFGASRKRD